MNTNDEHEYSRIADLIGKQISNEISPEEQEEVDGWLLDNPNGQALYERLNDEAQWQEALRRMGRFDEETAWARFGKLTQSNSENVVQLRSRKFIRYASAAAIVAGLSIGGYFLLHKQPSQQIAQNQLHDVAPGHNQATLTLVGGQLIILTKGLSGNLAKQGNTLVQVNNANAITYIASSGGENGPVQYNTLSTRRGEQSPYPLVLADGTKVWLNAASSITFPTAFNSNERIVKITGEAYFEVVHDAAHPFKVMFNNQTVEDIGTSFDINAYDDEPNDKTTLITGSVKVISNSNTVVLKPGQVAVSPHRGKIMVKDGDTEEAIAWKNGYFMFDSESLESVMRKVSRWYDVDVVYMPGQQMDERYLGSISRFSNVSKVLQMLEMTGDVKFKIAGNKIIVQKK